ncbi:MAG: hypothetical protein K9M17_00060 [Mariprofundaceae bacterium]|nr:hypothetical protein [Mariprofundaceae bacterium]
MGTIDNVIDLVMHSLFVMGMLGIGLIVCPIVVVGAYKRRHVYGLKWIDLFHLSGQGKQNNTQRFATHLVGFVLSVYLLFINDVLGKYIKDISMYFG